MAKVNHIDADSKQGNSISHQYSIVIILCLLVVYVTVTLEDSILQETVDYFSL